MKKFTIVASLFLSMAAITANAQEALYFRSNYNGYQGEEIPLVDAESQMYRGVFDNGYGYVYFNISTGSGTYLVPTTFKDYETSFDDDLTAILDYAEGTSGSVYWDVNGWNRGQLEVTVDLLNHQITLCEYKENNDDPQPETLYFMSSFNGYNRELIPLVDAETLTYRGVYEDAYSSVYFSISTGSGTYLVPPTLKDYETSFDEDMSVFLDFVESSNQAYWDVLNWSRGKVEVTVDYINKQIILSEYNESEDPGTTEPQPMYLRGDFNDWGYNNVDYWTLYPIDNETGDVYEGTFNISENKFAFNIKYMNMILFPATEETLNIVPQIQYDESLDADAFIGGYASLSFSGYYWEYQGWPGGEVYIKVDKTTSEITIVCSPNLDCWYLKGNFNDYSANSVKWALFPEDGGYAGIFDIDEPFQFQLISPNGTTYVPLNSTTYLGKTEVIDITEDSFEGSMVDAWLPNDYNCYWDCPTWEGGRVSITVNGDKITISAYEDVPTGVSNVEKNNYYKVFNLQGVKVMEGNDINNLPGGLYIINGKKVIVKNL